MPGMKLKIEPVQRLCGIDAAVCKSANCAAPRLRQPRDLDVMASPGSTFVDQRVLARLRAEYLSMKADGTYVRLTEGSLPTARPVKAELKWTPFVTTSRRAS